MMMRWLPRAFAVLMLVASIDAAACPICFRAMKLTPAQQMMAAERAVLAVPAMDGRQLRVIAVIKGGSAVDEMIPEESHRVDATTMHSTRPLLMLQSNLSPMWLSMGNVDLAYSDWLRQLAAATPDSSATETLWQERVAFVLPYLNNSEPIVAGMAYGELARAPYSALRALKPKLDAADLVGHIDDPSRQQLYTLLLGIAGSRQDAENLEQRLDVAWLTYDATNLAAMLAADLELRGPLRMSWIEKMYFTDPNRTMPELQACLLALSVQGAANGAVPRQRVIQAYRFFIRQRKPMAALVAADLALWGYWDAVPEYVQLLKSNAVRDPASRYAIIVYLKQSPRADAKAAVKSLTLEDR